jgi:hypothetical protein
LITLKVLKEIGHRNGTCVETKLDMFRLIRPSTRVSNHLKYIKRYCYVLPRTVTTLYWRNLYRSWITIFYTTILYQSLDTISAVLYLLHLLKPCTFMIFIRLNKIDEITGKINENLKYSTHTIVLSNVSSKLPRGCIEGL